MSVTTRPAAIAMVRTSSVAILLNCSCHVAELQLPWLLNYSCHLRSSAECHFWATAAVATCMVWSTTYHDLKNFRTCHLLTLDSCHVALKNMAKNMLRVKRELPSAYKHARVVAMYPTKHMATDDFWCVGEETGGQLPCILQNTWQLMAFGVWDRRRACG